MESKAPFWKVKSLKKMTRKEWESLCDGCGICCLEKVEDTDTGRIKTLSVSCQYLDTSTCRCLIYECRLTLADCIELTPYKVKRISWLPDTCAYRRVYEGRDLEWWHPLVSKSPNTVHEAGISVRDRAVSALDVHPDDLERLLGGYST